MTMWENELHAWETAKRDALQRGTKRVRPMLVKCGGYGRAVAPSHVNLLGETMAGWSPGQVAYVVRMSRPDGLQLWETVDGSHRVEAAKVFSWPFVVIAELGTDLAPDVMASFAIQADVEALRRRYVNFIDKVLVYTRLLEVLALKKGSNECPSLNEMLEFDACEKMGQRKARSNLQDFHKYGRLVFHRETPKLRLSRFSASLSTEQSHRLTANLVRDNWVVSSPGGNLTIPLESVVLSTFQSFTEHFVSLEQLVDNRPVAARQPIARGAATTTAKTKRRRAKRRISWADAVPAEETKAPARRLSTAGSRRSTAQQADAEGGKGSSKKDSGSAGEQAAKEAGGSASAGLPAEVMSDTPWQLSVEEAARTKSIFIKATKRKVDNVTIAQREAIALGLYSDKDMESNEYRLYARRRLPAATEIPLWGAVNIFKSTPPVGVKGLILLRRLSLCATLVTHLQLSAKSAAYYATSRDYRYNAIVVERIETNTKSDFLRAADDYAENIRAGRYSALFLPNDVEADSEIVVKPIQPLGEK